MSNKLTGRTRRWGRALIAVAVAIVLLPLPPVIATPLQDPRTETLLPRGDIGWPRATTTESGARAVLYQPQVAEWADQKLLKAVAAMSYQPSGVAEPQLGTVTFEANTYVSVAERLVAFSPLRVIGTNFPTLSKEDTRVLVDEIVAKLPAEERVISLDRVLSQISMSALTPKNAAGIKTDPPDILVSARPAVLVSFDGDPIWSPIEANDLEFTVNTNWDLFRYGPTGLCYLRFENTWLKAAAIEGPWSPAGRLPASFSKLPADDNWKDVRAAIPGRPAGATPKVFVVTQPTELIVTTGAPTQERVAGTSLQWISNTESDLFRDGARGPFYYLVAGRWFTATTLAGPWTFTSTSLPPDFTRIPREHPRSRVLASVPGTDEANEAVLIAAIPQTARVNKNEIVAPEVVYQGDPEFEDIPGTSVDRATNTGLDVFLVGEAYYMCYDGVWFVSDGSTGPWVVASSVPDQIYEIPADSPAYHVTYVEVEEDDNVDDEWVSFACYAGYTGLVVAWGCAVWGSGWYYPSYVWRGAGRLPVYYPRARTYGSSARYNPWTGSYGAGARAYGPYGGVANSARYNAATGTYVRGASAYGSSGARDARAASNPRTGTAAATRHGAGVYGSWGANAVKRGDDWAQTTRMPDNVSDRTSRAAKSNTGGAVGRDGRTESGFAATGGDNVYAGRDGNVYRKGDGGAWQKWDDARWDPVQRPEAAAPKLADRSDGTSELDRRLAESATYNQLERDRGARNEGAQRTRDFGNYQRGGGGNRDAGSYQPSGGASRGGGGGGARGGGGGRRRG
ncbi:MAG: hypothetical protein IPF53_18160 [Blastocatellia bacterium]|nr:hypothetical protein [Blastocatellia bacterium]MBK6426977.1 hypothetical protein [Blastocatellia bacterium]